jgi:hypothetical protein
VQLLGQRRGRRAQQAGGEGAEVQAQAQQVPEMLGEPGAADGGVVVV